MRAHGSGNGDTLDVPRSDEQPRISRFLLRGSGARAGGLCGSGRIRLVRLGFHLRVLRRVAPLSTRASSISLASPFSVSFETGHRVSLQEVLSQKLLALSWFEHHFCSYEMWMPSVVTIHHATTNITIIRSLTTKQYTFESNYFGNSLSTCWSKTPHIQILSLRTERSVVCHIIA